MAPLRKITVARGVGGALLVVGFLLLLLGALLIFAAGGEKELDRCYYRNDPLVQRMFDEGLETSEGPDVSRSILPPGTICTWDFKDGTRHVVGPSWVPVWITALGWVTAAGGAILAFRSKPHD